MRLGSRARSTSLGIALCTMFIVASFSIVGGLKASMDRLEGNFSSDYYLVTSFGESGFEPFEPDAVTASLDRCAVGLFVDVALNVTPAPAAVFYIADSEDPLFPSLPHPSSHEVYVPSEFNFGSFGVQSHLSEADVTVAGILATDQFPRNWILAGADLVGNLTGMTGMANFVVAQGLTESQRSHLVSEGFSVQSMTGIVDFLGMSVEQIHDDMFLVLVPSAFVVAVLSYGFVGIETADRRHDIGIMKTIGAGRRRILGYLFAGALLIGVWGGLLGLALGIVLSYAISTAVSSAFTSVFIMRVDLWLLALAFVTTLAASTAGSLIPSLRMTFSRPVDDLRGESR